MQRWSRIGLLVAALAVVALTTAACSRGGAGDTPVSTAGKPVESASSGGPTVIVKKGGFKPPTVTIKVGDTVTFKNEDSQEHDILIDYQELGSMAKGKSVYWQATTAGKFGYSCMYHSDENGKVIVK